MESKIDRFMARKGQWIYYIQMHDAAHTNDVLRVTYVVILMVRLDFWMHIRLWLRENCLVPKYASKINIKVEINWNFIYWIA